MCLCVAKCIVHLASTLTLISTFAHHTSSFSGHAQAAEYDIAARTPTALALLVLQWHVRLQAYWGADALESALYSAGVVPAVRSLLGSVKEVSLALTRAYDMLWEGASSGASALSGTAPDLGSGASSSTLGREPGSAAEAAAAAAGGGGGGGGSGQRGTTADKSPTWVSQGGALASVLRWGSRVRAAAWAVACFPLCHASSAAVASGDFSALAWDACMAALDRWGLFVVLVCTVTLVYARWSTRYHERLDRDDERRWQEEERLQDELLQGQEQEHGEG